MTVDYKKEHEKDPGLGELETQLLFPTFAQVLWPELKRSRKNLPQPIKTLVESVLAHVGAILPIPAEIGEKPKVVQTQIATQEEVLSTYLWHLEQVLHELPINIQNIVKGMLLFRDQIRATIPEYVGGDRLIKKKPVPVPKRAAHKTNGSTLLHRPHSTERKPTRH